MVIRKNFFTGQKYKILANSFLKNLQLQEIAETAKMTATKWLMLAANTNKCQTR
jgi:hypothetical protein